MTWDLRIYLPSEGRCVADFYRPYKCIALAGTETANSGSSCKHTNHYTNATTCVFTVLVLLTEDIYKLRRYDGIR
jgi:hypothetical protein